MMFVNLKGNYYAVSSIISVRKTRSSKGTDGVSRNIVVRVTPDAVGTPTKSEHCNIWCSEEEAADLYKFLEIGRPAITGCNICNRPDCDSPNQKH